MAVYRAPDPFPNRMFRQLRYATNLFPASAATQWNAGTEVNFRLNSIFDPDATGGAHQPYGMDTLATLYNRYVVHRAHVRLTVQNTAGNQSGAVVCIVRPSNGGFALAGNSVTDILEKPMCHALFPRPTGDTVKYDFVVPIHEAEGVTALQLKANLEEYSALMSANPGRTPFFALAIANTASTSVINFSIVVEIDYDVELYDRITLAASN